MPQASAAVRNTPSTRKTPTQNVSAKQLPRSDVLPRPREKIVRQHDIEDTHALKDYQLGDCLGRGAHGAVYRALNWGTGETVAVKRIKLADLPQNDLQTIMMEIDLMKNLHHPNIVKYHGFVKTSISLYIIMEYCENGSLHSICKNFGKFPEGLVGLYMSQVLNGLLYLHEQGVIHRDIKGANILTTKEGTVKVADFGVAQKDDPGNNESMGAVGTPHWMAPEVIQLFGHTTAADIWSLGCTVIELLDGKPPYNKMEAPAALFRMVSDDHPPFPEAISPTVKDFLVQCFQKDPILRVSAKKLLKHPWIVNAKKAQLKEPVKPTVYDEAVRNIKQWNEALKSPEGTVAAHSPRLRQDTQIAPLPSEMSLVNGERTHMPPANGGSPIAKPRSDLQRFKSPSNDVDETECWDEDFASSIGSQALKLPQLQPVDNFDGKLSSEQIRAQMSNDSPFLQSDGSPVRRMKNRSDSYGLASDLMETLRPNSPAKYAWKSHDKQPLPTRTPTKVSQRIPSLPRTQIHRPNEKQASPSKPAKAASRPNGLKRTSSMFKEQEGEDYSDLISGDGEEDALQQKLEQLRIKQQAAHLSKPSFTHMDDLRSSPHSASDTKSSPAGSDTALSLRRVRSSMEIMKFADKLEDATDFSDVFGNDESALVSKNVRHEQPSSMLTKISHQSWPGDDEDHDDPFAQLEEDLDEMDDVSKVAKNHEVKFGALVESLVDSLKSDQPDDVLADVSDQLKNVLMGYSDMKQTIIRSHGLLPILEVLENCPHKDITLSLLKIINIIIDKSPEIQENLCFIGAIPIITRFANKKYPSDIRIEAAAFVRQISSNAMTHQMFISCGGLNVLVEFLEEDYDEERDLVLIGVTGIWNVFALQASTLRTDFCRILSRSAILYPLSLILDRVLDESGELARLVQERIVSIFLIFSQAEYHVKESIADRMVLKRVLKDLSRMQQKDRITMLKFIKNLSMLATTLDALHGANAIETLIGLLENSRGQDFEDMSNHVINIMFNLCRLNKTRQEDAALNGLVPILQRLIKTQRPVKEFALPILCDIAHSGKIGRKCLWQHKALPFYIELLAEPYWQVTALDAIFVWLQEETAKVEEHLLNSTFSDAVEHCFSSSKGDSFENLLEPLQKLLRLSPPVAGSLARPKLFDLTKERLHNRKPVVRGNLLRIMRSICDASDEGCGQLRRHKLYTTIKNLAEADQAILVRNMAADIMASSEAAKIAPRSSIDGLNRYRPSRRTSSAAVHTPPALHSSSSQPPTPQHSRAGAPADDYFDMPSLYPSARARPSNVSSISSRPASRDGSKVGFLGGVAGATAQDAMSARSNAYSSQDAMGVAKRRMSRPAVTRPPPSKTSKTALSPRKEENSAVAGREERGTMGPPPPVTGPSSRQRGLSSTSSATATGRTSRARTIESRLTTNNE